MRLQPKTEREIAEESLFAAGEYDFEILSAADKVSRSGNEMIEVKLAIYAPDGSKRGVMDYLLESMAYKLRHFCAACNLMDRYAAGELSADDCVGRMGRCKIVIDDKNADYPPKNAVKDYIVPKAGGGSQTQAARPERAEPARSADTASGDAADAEINPDSLPF